MDELTVFSIVVDFLENRFGSGSVGRADVDLVASTRKAKVQVECKGTKANIDRAIGQCLRYYIKNGRIPIFLCVPDSFYKLETLRDVLDSLKLPMGLLIVKENKDIIVGRIPEGAERIMERFRICSTCGIPLSSIVSHTGELTGYLCPRCGTETKVDLNFVAQFVDLDEYK